MKKSYYYKVILPIALIGFIGSLLILIVGIKFISSYSNIKHDILMENFVTEIKFNQNSINLQSSLIPLINKYEKSYNISYLMVININRQIIVSSDQKEFGQIFKDNFYEKNLFLRNRVERRLNQPENVFEMLEPVEFNGQKVMAVLAFNTVEESYQQTMVIVVSLFLFIILLFAGILISHSISKINLNFIGKFDSIIQNIILEKKIDEKEFISDIPEFRSSMICLKNLSQQMIDYKEKNDALKFDSITGLYSLQYIQDELHYELKRSYRYDRPLSCIIIEIDNLREIIFKCSMDEVDFTVKEIADLIKNSLRKVDVPGVIEKGTYIIVLPEIQLHQAEIVRQRLAGIVGEYKLSHGSEQISLTVNSGVNTYLKELGEVDEKVFFHQMQIALQGTKFIKYFKTKNPS